MSVDEDIKVAASGENGIFFVLLSQRSHTIVRALVVVVVFGFGTNTRFADLLVLWQPVTGPTHVMTLLVLDTSSPACNTCQCS